MEEQSFKSMIFQMDPKNKKCIDCGEENIKYVSVNNGITLCDLCGDIHKSLGNQISFIREIDSEFDEYLKKYFIFGGNRKFRKKLKPVIVNFNRKRLDLYKTYACDYYRRYLKAKVLEKPKPESDFKNPNEVMPIDSHSFPEFEDYTLKDDFENINNNKIEINDKNYAFSNDDAYKRSKSIEDRREIKVNLKSTNEIFEDDLKRVPMKKLENCDDCFDENNYNRKKKNFLRKSLNKIKKVGVFIKKEGSKGYGIIKKVSKDINNKYHPGTKIKTVGKFIGNTINKIPGVNQIGKNEGNNIRVEYGNKVKEDDKDESNGDNLRNNNVEQLDFE